MAKGIKTGGREQGTPNKLTKELRSILKNILAKELEAIPDHLKKLDTKDRMEMIVKLIPYVLPKLESINYNIENESSKKEIDYATMPTDELLERARSIHKLKEATFKKQQ